MKRFLEIYSRSKLHAFFVFIRFAFRGKWISPSGKYSGVLSRSFIGHGVKLKGNCVINVPLGAVIKIGDGTWISHSVEVDVAKEVSIGDGTTVQRRVTINGNVKIGRSCIIAPNVFISSGTHPFREYPELSIREQEKMIREKEGGLGRLDQPVSIGDDCWIGVNSVICPGVTIGNSVVVGAGSVVTHDIEDYQVVAGVPAKAIGVR